MTRGIHLIVSLLILVVVISCGEDESSNDQTQDKTASTDDNPSVIGLWSEGPRDYGTPTPNPMIFIRQKSEWDIAAIPICNYKELTHHFSTNELKHHTFYHFLSETHLDMITAISVPSMDYMCQVEGLTDREYEIRETGMLMVLYADSFFSKGIFHQVNNNSFRLFTGPI